MKALEILNKLKNKMLNFSSKDVEEAIAQVKALQQRSCEGCRYYKKDNTTDCNGFTQDEECLRFIDEIHRIPCNDFCCNRYEAKEQ